MSRAKEDGFGAPFMPTPEELAERAEMVRRSWYDPELRERLGLKSMRVLPVGEPEEQDEL